MSFCKTKSLPGFKGVSIYTVVSFVISEARKYDITTRANSVAFSFFLAIFPAIIFLFTLLPYLNISFDFLEVFRESTQRMIPQEAHSYLFGIIDDLISIERKGLASVGFILALFFSSGGMLTLMMGFDKTYPEFKKRGILKRRLIALYLTVLLSALFVLSLVVIVFGKSLLAYATGYIEQELIVKTIIYFARILFSFCVIYVGVTLIYQLGPSLVRRVSFWNPGAVLATILSIFSSLIFAYFVNRFGTYNEVYGSIGALIVIMIWLQINAFIIIIGFELNASIAVNKEADHSKLS